MSPPAPASAAALADAIARADRHAPFLHGLLGRETALVGTLQADGPAAAIAAATRRLDPADAAASLRAARRGIALTTALADLAGIWSLEETTAALSRFADTALEFALRAAFAAGGTEPEGIAVLALGKLGSHELNYSSDIDIIFLHDPARIPHRRSQDPTEAAVRIVRRVVALLSQRTADGHVFRVDLRLRPDPDGTSPSLPATAAVGYYQSQALAWERAAFIRARACAGDLDLGASFLREIQPFVWRRSLDYSAIAEIRKISSRIRGHYARQQQPGPGFDLKRGRGGIREVEFFAQIHQLIFGGRDPALRAPATLDALAALARADKIAVAEAELLGNAYRFYRTLEHRIQMLNDQQTHAIPESAAGRAALAGLAGHADWPALAGLLLPQVEAVGRLYDDLLATGNDDGGDGRMPMVAGEIADWARAHAIADPELLADLIDNWRAGRARSLRAPDAQSAFEQVMPQLVADVGSGAGGRDALLRFTRMVEALPSGVQFWRLLAARPELQSTVAQILTATPVLADALARNPSLIDILLVPAAPLASAEAALAELSAAARGLRDEALLNRVRVWTAERRFQIGVQLINAAIAPAAAARELAFMADAAIHLLAEAVVGDFSAQHGTVPGGRLIPLALGRLGGGELTAQSDLDLVLLFSGSFEAVSDGASPLGASAWFNRVGQRLIAALTVATPAGRLYEVDTRLRPSGEDGLLVISLDSFRDYQLQRAGLWEHLALTRARPVLAAAADAAATQAVLDAIICQPRDAATVRAEALAMRRHMRQHKPARGPYDLKLMAGGLADIEFIIETRALIAGRRIPAALVAAAGEVAPELAGAARLMMDVLILLRLVQPHDSTATPDHAASMVIARACGHADFSALRRALAAARRTVLAEWRQTFATDAREI